MVETAEIGVVQPENDRKLPVVALAPDAKLSVGGSPEPLAIHHLAAGDPNANATDAIGLVDKIRSAISGCVLEFEQVRPESMSVVVRPDPETAVQLQMRLVNGEMRVGAHLELGDFSRLNLNWSDLQQALSRQKIHLADLSDGSNFLSGFPEVVLPRGSEACVTRCWPQSQSAPRHKNLRPRALATVRGNRESKFMQTIPTNSTSSPVPENVLDHIPIKTVNQEDFLKVVASQLATPTTITAFPQSPAMQADLSDLPGSKGHLTQ